MDYEEFIESKKFKYKNSGFEVSRESLNKNMFEFQKDCVIWALRKGKAALFQDCGLGKTIQQLDWASKVCEYTKGKVLILAPLAVSKQTQREGEKFGIKVTICRSQEDVQEGINITNYEILHKFNANEFIGVVLDESSILKSFSGKIRNEIIDTFKFTPYKLSCTATPSPNDFMELGNQSEFLNIMNRSEMLATFFIHDGGDTAKWRLKGHAESKFWEWVSSWGVMVREPSDLGYEIETFKLPKLNIVEDIVEVENDENTLIPMAALTLEERRKARKGSLKKRVKKAAEIANSTNEQYLVWCDFNNESEELKKAIIGSVEVKGADTPEHKTNSMMGFAQGKIKTLVSKSTICGFGMNFQSCHNIIFCGLSDSYESFYQAVRRCWRFGQTKEVNVYVIIGEKEISVLNNIKRKETDSELMADNMLKFTKEITLKNLKKSLINCKDYKTSKEMILPQWLKTA